MDLKSGYPFWIVRNGLLHDFPALREHEHVDCDVLVVGAGITGALIAWHLQQDGHHVCVIDRREAAWGSTAASTALLQYEIDTELQDLTERYGEADAVLAYRACADAVKKLGRIARRLRNVDFRSMKSLYFASHWYHRARLLDEAALRHRHRFPSRVLDDDEVRREFGFDAPAAILTPLAAEVDPYRMAYSLLGVIQKNGGRVYDRTAMSEFRSRRKGVEVTMDRGAKVRARHLVLAAGYEAQSHLDDRVATNRSSYAFITDPVEGGLGPLHDCLVWESARPYLYMRTTGDGRLLVGGEDDAHDIPAKRDAMVMRKAGKLLKRTLALFPALELQPAFAWAGTFAETTDGLPFFGPHPQHGPHVHFAMAYGGNGITYSLIGAEILRERLGGRAHACEALFSFERLKRM